MLLNDKQIKDLPVDTIFPFVPALVKEVDGNDIVSYGLTSFGYDVRLGTEFAAQIDQRQSMSPQSPPDYHKFESNAAFIAPGETLLGVTMEHFKIPEDICVICQGKSTYARLGLIVNCTPMEPEWEGFYTMALINGSRNTIKVRSGQGIAQLQFYRSERPLVTYADRKGKYQGVINVSGPRL